MTVRLQRTILSPDDREFFAILAGCGMGYGVLVALLSLVPTPPPSRTDVQSLPPRLAKLILETPATPPTVTAPARPPRVEAAPPAPQTPKPAPRPKPELRPTPEHPEALPSPPHAEDMAAARAAETAVEAQRLLEAEAAARERDRAVAKQSGLLKALGEPGGEGNSSGSKLDRVLSDVSVLSDPSLPASGHDGGLPTTDSAPGPGEHRLSVDDLVAGLKAPGSEAVILSGKNQTRVESSLAVQDAGSTRSLESIRKETKALDTWLKFKYREALRVQPALGTTLTVEFTITPQGGVTDCRVAASDLHAPQLEAAILKRFCLLRFAPLPEGSDDEVTVKYPIDFEGLGS